LQVRTLPPQDKTLSFDALTTITLALQQHLQIMIPIHTLGLALILLLLRWGPF
jgi:hypothetical protein